MSVLDVVLLVLLLAYAVSGFRQGLVVGVLSLVGFVGGAVAAMALLPSVVDEIGSQLLRLVAVVGGVLLGAWLGQVLGVLLGARLRDAVTWRPARVVDSLLGAVAGLVALSLVLWFVAGALRSSGSTTVSRAVSSSQVLGVIDSLVPPQTSRLLAGVRTVVQDSAFPRVFSGLAPEQIVPVDPPGAGIATAPAVAAAGDSVVKITGRADACGRGQEGTGWVLQDRRVVTNAHVVAGVDRPTVQVGGEGRRLDAEVVVFDPRRDLAVLAVEDLEVEPLPLGGPLERGDEAVVAGYPLDGPYRLDPARVRQVVEARGEDIYGRAGVVREVYSLFARVEPGNSGGPVLAEDGSVVAVVFAKSLDDPQTGYALTVAEAQPVLDAAGADTPVSTGGCAAS